MTGVNSESFDEMSPEQRLSAAPSDAQSIDHVKPMQDIRSFVKFLPNIAYRNISETY
jgi:hypothetical protein